MSNLTILRKYAQKSDPTKISPDILFAHTSTSLTIFDAYPKALFHFLVLPRLLPPLTTTNANSLKTLLRADSDIAKTCLQGLAKDAHDARGMIEAEMIERYGFKWPVWMGFHAVIWRLSGAYRHLHLHVISSELCSPSLKVKKHYNSFHPKLGFFLHLDEVLSWFDAVPSYFKTMAKLDKAHYEAKLKEPLECFHCEKEMKNMPALKEHLQGHWEKMIKAHEPPTSSSSSAGRKRQRGESEASVEAAATDSDEPANKKREVIDVEDD